MINLQENTPLDTVFLIFQPNKILRLANVTGQIHVYQTHYHPNNKLLIISLNNVCNGVT